MKKLLLGALLLLSMVSFGQLSTLDKFIGYWEPDQHSTQIVFWKDVNQHFQMVEFSTISGEVLTLNSLKLVEKSIVVKTTFDSRNWNTQATFTLLDDKTMKCVVTGDGEGIITYTKIK